MVDEKTLEEMRRNFDVDPHRSDPDAKRRGTRKNVLHDLIRRFVRAYIAEADPDTPDTDMCDEEREDLKNGVREKWAIPRAAEHYRREDRTIREAVNPSKRSRSRI
jgi:hypothetical protein